MPNFFSFPVIYLGNGGIASRWNCSYTYHLKSIVAATDVSVILDPGLFGPILKLPQTAIIVAISPAAAVATVSSKLYAEAGGSVILRVSNGLGLLCKQRGKPAWIYAQLREL